MTIEIVKPPRVAIVKTDGINCDLETNYAFEKAGARSEIVHVNELNERRNLNEFQIVVIPGGFSYGDDVASGRIMAIEMQTRFANEFLEYTQKGKLVVGICNGFQVLMQSGLLPFGQMQTIDQNKATLTHNDSQRFESRWVNIRYDESVFPFTVEDETLSLPVAHGEGKFITDSQTLAKIEKNGQIVFRYCTSQGIATLEYPQNPNGSMNAIAGVCDPSGKIIGLMPHPERFVEKWHHPNWRRNTNMNIDGLTIISNIVEVAKQL